MSKKLFTVLCVTFTVLFATLPVSAQLREDRDPRMRIDRNAAVQIEELLAEKEHRTKAQQKIDSQLIYAMKLHRGQRITPHVEFLETTVETDLEGLTIVDISAAVTDQLLNDLGALGAHILSYFPRYNAVQAAVPLDAVESIAAMPQVQFIQPKQEAMTTRMDDGAGEIFVSTDLPSSAAARRARIREQVAAALPIVAAAKQIAPNVGSRNSEGDATHRASGARITFGVNGAGVKIGVLSNGVVNLAASQALGDLGPVTVLPSQTGTGDEGTAMLEIIHDLAPGAQLYFATANTSLVSFAQNIRDLRTAGCDIIVDDVFYFVETPFHDGQLAPTNTNGAQVIQAVNDVTASGALYFSSAGNSGNLNDGTSGTWEGDFVDGGPTASPLPLGNRLHNFGGSAFDTLTLATTNPINLYWSDPLGASSNDYDLFRLNSTGTTVRASSTNIQNGTQDPEEQISGSNAATGDRILIVQKAGGQARFLHLCTNRGRLGIATAGQTHGHAAAANAFGCAATPAAGAFTSGSPIGPYPNPFNAANLVEQFSSDGPRRVFYRADGTAYTSGNVSSTGGVVRQKPDITAADGVSVTGVGNFGSPFYGTSAAAPHAAAIAGLIKSANSAFTPAQIRSALQNTAIDIETSGVDRNSGSGIIMALEAINSLGVAGLPNPEIAAFTAAEAPGNGNALIEAGEGATLFVTLKNTGAADANNVMATLTTSTPGIVLAQPNAFSYGNLLKGASATNGSPFRFAVQPNVPCPQTIVFTLTITSPQLPSARALSFNVSTGLPPATVSTRFGTAPPTGAGFTSLTGTQTVRIFRDGVASVCDPPKAAFPGTTAAGITRRYEAYTFNLCPNATNSCVRITMSGTSAINLFVAAYKDSYDPNNLATNYLADAGASAASRTFTANVPAGHNLVVVVADVTPPGGNNVAYSLLVEGCISSSCPVPNQFPIARAAAVTVLAGPTCSATASIDNGSSDPEGGPLTFSQSPAGPYALGTTPVQMTVFDNKGAFAQASANVTVVDMTAPTINCPADIVVNNTPGLCSASVTITPATATDNCSTPTVNGIRSDGQPLAAIYPVGTTMITWTATDAAGNQSSCVQKVTVKDNEAPTLNVPSPITAEFTDENGAAVSFVVTSSDNCPGVAQSCAPASGNTFPIGTTAVTCTAVDLASNSTTRTFTVTVLGALGVKLDVLNELQALQATVTDHQDSDALLRSISGLKKSTDIQEWTDQTHVKDSSVFQNEKDAVNQLTNVIRRHGTDATLQGFVNRIMKSDRLLCTVAINEAAANTTARTQAVNLRASGDQMVASGQYESAIEQYRNSWSKAVGH